MLNNIIELFVKLLFVTDLINFLTLVSGSLSPHLIGRRNHQLHAYPHGVRIRELVPVGVID